jgi:hypothetical protein
LTARVQNPVAFGRFGGLSSSAGRDFSRGAKRAPL